MVLIQLLDRLIKVEHVYHQKHNVVNWSKRVPTSYFVLFLGVKIPRKLFTNS